MDISIIIVNYNVKYFLEQCLCSVQKAIAGFDAEVIVVDNGSEDGSIAYLQPMFPSIHFISNKKNIGFSRANNVGLSCAKGHYIVFLNPDTLIPENIFANCISFFETHACCGALGVRMIDGRGIFLPESKRSFPSPLVSFYKLTGLSSLFSISPHFNRYALGYLDEEQVHEVDVLAGAFMMVRKNVIEQTKGFDESFFMYGEDVDLSYRIQQLGYKNYYTGRQTIIHFKGESRKKGSLNHIRMFYGAMNTFVGKHYSGGKATLFSWFIQLSIAVRALFSLFYRLFDKVSLPAMDALTVFICLYSTERGWVHFIRHGKEFDTFFVPYAIPLYTFVFLAAAAVSGIYDDLYKPSKAFLCCISAIIVLLAAYSLLPEQLRFSRGVVLVGGIVSGLAITFFRWVSIRFNIIGENENDRRLQQTLIVGTDEEYNKVSKLLQQAGLEEKVLGRIAVSDDRLPAIGTISQLPALIKELPVHEILFCEGVLSYQTIITQIQLLPKQCRFRFYSGNSHSVVGSDSKTTSGETLTAEGFYKLSQPYQQRMKRVVDVFIAALLLIGFPVHLVLIKKGGTALLNACKVLLGNKTWIGYTSHRKHLPVIHKSVLSSYGYPVGSPQPVPEETLFKADRLYAKNYEWLTDLKLIITHYKRLGGEI